ncbi:type II toxin-antitoxin system RelE/ParE family toxin, partial [Vreelandella alkaliphila]|uniref:type II toxin-antitoxin system RelE/ParE family toxin n=1 Tax=Vreelandella alkaliphila TaxID=272774 RepID=UPI003FD803B7
MPPWRQNCRPDSQSVTLGFTLKMAGTRPVRIFKNAWFDRFARKQKLEDAALLDAIQRAEQGLIDADLGGGVI